MAYSLERTVKDADLVPISGAQVYVYDAEGALAALVTAGGAPTDNPATTSADGYAAIFTAQEGLYTLKYFWAGRERLIEATAVAGRGPIEIALAAAAAAEAANGPTYASTAAGLAATTSGQAFAVDAGGGLVSVYLNSSGAAVFQRTILTATALAATGGAGRVGLSQGGTVEDAITWATPAMYGAVGDGIADDTQALRDMFVSGYRKFDLGNGKTYKVSLLEGTYLGKFTGGEVEIKGENVLIYDVSPGYTNNGAFTAIIWGEGTQRLSCVGVNYEGPLLSDLTAQLGYRGATFVRVTDGAKNTHVVANLVNVRYAIQSGDYNLWDRGYCDGFTGVITGQRIGYPIALYLASNINVDVDCDQFHRLAYYAGCRHIRGTLKGKDQYGAPIFSLITDSKTSATSSFGCLDYKVKVFDKGSTVYVAGARLVAIAPQWSFAGTEWDDIDLHAHIVSTDSVASKLGHASIYTQDSVGIPWRSDQKFKNIKVSGVLDRSAQTTTEVDSAGEVYIYAFTGAGVPVFDGFTMRDFTYKPGSGSKPRGFWFYMPGLVGGGSIENVNFGDAPVRYATNATGMSKFVNTTLKSSFPGSDSPYLSNIAFDNCVITDAANQPATNKRYVNTLANGGGATSERLMTELTLTGASVTFSNSLPNNTVILGVSGRVTEVITGATGYTVGTATSASRFANTNTLTAGSTFGPANGTDTAPQFQVGTGSVVVTAKTSNFTAGKLRLFVDFIRITPPTS